MGMSRDGGTNRRVEWNPDVSWSKFTMRARRIVFFAQEEAARRGENEVGTEHLLLGLVRENDSVAARILERVGVSLDDVRADMEAWLKPGPGNLGTELQLTPTAVRTINLTFEEARQLNNSYVGTEHLLLGHIREGECAAARVLTKWGATLDRTRRVLYAMQQER
jgi:ATP-dependent Clp protease ATP-binding subunit ClpC